jgi:DNA invertase Pin-like site-specific DNA recombinase
MKRYGYIRVSTKLQNEESQKDILMKVYGLTEQELYIEKKSGKSIKDRPVIQYILSQIKEGDSLYITRISRLGRNLLEILTLVLDLIEKRKINVYIYDMGSFTYPLNPSQKMSLAILISVAEAQREIMRENTIEALNCLKEKGIKLGRKVGYRKVNPDLIISTFNRLKVITKVAKELNISKETIYRALKQANINLNIEGRNSAIYLSRRSKNQEQDDSCSGNCSTIIKDIE